MIDFEVRQPSIGVRLLFLAKNKKMKTLQELESMRNDLMRQIQELNSQQRKLFEEQKVIEAEIFKMKNGYGIGSTVFVDGKIAEVRSFSFGFPQAHFQKKDGTFSDSPKRIYAMDKVQVIHKK